MERFPPNFAFEPSEEDILEAIKRLEEQYPAPKPKPKPKPKPEPEPELPSFAESEPSEADILAAIEREEDKAATTTTPASKPKPKPKPDPVATAPKRSNLAIGPQQAKAFVEAYKVVLGTGVDRSEVRDPDNVNRAYDDLYNQALMDAGISPYADIIGGEGGQQGGGALSLTISPSDYVEFTGAPAYLTDILKKGKARNEDEARSAYAVLSMTDRPRGS